MSEPDELYTLRAQYWLGHYNLAIQEAKSVARRPMSPALKAEREEFLVRSYTALGQYDKITNTETIGLQAWALKAQYEAADGNPTKQGSIIDQLKVLAGQDYNNTTNSSAALAAAQVLVQDNQIPVAFQLLGNSTGLEHLATKLQILLKIDRFDLAKNIYHQLRSQDEDSIVTQLASVYIHLAEGRSSAADADHTVTMLTEQYGASSLLLNLTAAALLMLGNYTAAESKLQEALSETDTKVAADTYINLITSYVHQNKYDQASQIIGVLQSNYPNHPYCASYDRTNTAFDREAIKYKV